MSKWSNPKESTVIKAVFTIHEPGMAGVSRPGTFALDIVLADIPCGIGSPMPWEVGIGLTDRWGGGIE